MHAGFLAAPFFFTWQAVGVALFLPLLRSIQQLSKRFNVEFAVAARAERVAFVLGFNALTVRPQRPAQRVHPGAQALQPFVPLSFRP